MVLIACALGLLNPIPPRRFAPIERHIRLLQALIERLYAFKLR